MLRGVRTELVEVGGLACFESLGNFATYSARSEFVALNVLKIFFVVTTRHPRGEIDEGVLSHDNTVNKRPMW